jgi:hypothetical protein
MNEKQKKWLKILISILLLSSLGWLAVSRGQIIQKFDGVVFICNSIVALTIVVLNGFMLRWTTFMFANPLSMTEAVLVASSGAFVNAAGGLPIGTAMVMLILAKQHGYRLDQLIIGKIISLGLSVSSLLLFFACSRYFAGQYLFALAAFIGVAIILFLIRVTPAIKWLPQHIRSGWQSLVSQYYFHGLCLALVIAAMMLFSYWIVMRHYLPNLTLYDTIAIASASLMTGFVMMANALGGVQEVVVGIMSMAYALKFVDGVDIGLFIRVCSLAGAGSVYLVAYILYKHRLRKNKDTA